MTKLTGVVAGLAVLAGCAAFQQGLKDATEGIKPNAAALPEGEGWFCYAATQKEWSGCNRTLEACNDDRKEAQKLFQVNTFDFSNWGRCLPSPQAFCATYQAQNFTTGKMEDQFGCFPDELSCSGWSANPPRGAFRMSKCGLFKEAVTTGCAAAGRRWWCSPPRCP